MHTRNHILLPLSLLACSWTACLDLDFSGNSQASDCIIPTVLAPVADVTVASLDCQAGVARAVGDDTGATLRVVSERTEGLRMILMSDAPLANGPVPSSRANNCLPDARAYVCDVGADGTRISPLRGNLQVLESGRLPVKPWRSTCRTSFACWKTAPRSPSVNGPTRKRTRASCRRW